MPQHIMCETGSLAQRKRKKSRGEDRVVADAGGVERAGSILPVAPDDFLQTSIRHDGRECKRFLCIKILSLFRY